MYYQVNASYYSALGESEEKLLLARAMQLFMPGKPQVWYLDLFAGSNDIEAVRRAGPGGHKQINRTNLTHEELERRLAQPVVRRQLAQPVVRRQLKLLRFRTICPAFDFDSDVRIEAEDGKMRFLWLKNGYTAQLDAYLQTLGYTDCATGPDVEKELI